MGYCKFFAGVSLLLLFSSCSEGESELEEIKYPDTISWNLRQVSIEGKRRVVSIAGKLEIFDDDELSVFTDAVLQEYNEENVLVKEGRAGKVRVFRESEGTASGNVLVKDFSENAEVKASALSWAEENRTLLGEGVVTIESEDGLSVSGTGFSADLARSTYVFKDGTQGIVTTEEETQASDTTETLKDDELNNEEELSDSSEKSANENDDEQDDERSEVEVDK